MPQPARDHGHVRRGRLAAALAVLLSSPLAPVAAQPADNLSRDDAVKQLEEKKRDLETMRSKADLLSEEVDSLGRDRAKLNEQLIETAGRIQTSEARLSQIEDRVGELSGRETAIRSSIEERHDTIARLLSAMQRMGGQPPPAIITRRDDVLKMVRSAMLMAALYPELKSQADSLTRDLDDMVRLQTQMAEEGARLRDETQRLAQEREQAKRLLADKKAMLATRQDELSRLRKVADQQGKTVAQLGELVQRMDKELAGKMAEYESELAAAAKRERADTVEIAPKPSAVAFVSPGRIKPAVPFAQSKASLRLPVQGSPVRRFGDADKFGGSAKGIAVQTRENAQVTAPTDGWVVYADEFRGYGQLLIINAGGGYHVLLAGMRQIDVSLGQFVLAGEPVAVMGAEAPGERRGSEQARPVLYVEFRKDGQPIDPDPWWAETPEKVQG